MKKAQRVIALGMILTLSLSTVSYAKDNNRGNYKKRVKSYIEKYEDRYEEYKEKYEDKYEDRDDDVNEENDKEKYEDVKKEKTKYEKSYWKQRKKIDKEMAKQLRKEIRESVKSKYLEKELEILEKRMEELKRQYENLTVLPVDSIISNTAKFKFDTPPVVKAGRTLIPVRAVTEGFGADVAWNQEEKKVTISKDNQVIELWIGLTEVKVNGEAIELDTMPEVMNSRTIVPLRFIAETLGLTVEYQKEDETIELIEEEPEVTEEEAEIIEEEPETTTGSAITL